MELNPPLERISDSGLLIITLNRGEQGNLLNPSVLSSLSQALQDGFLDSSIRVILLRSNTAAFCNGMDLGALSDRGRDTTQLTEAVKSYSRLLNSIYTSGKPVIALITGETRAGGVGLACACDIVCATPGASFGLSEAFIGLIPANVLPYLTGYRLTPQKARYLSLTAKTLSGEEAHRLGVVDEIAEPKDMEKLLKTRVRQLLRCAPEALAHIKRLTGQMAGNDHEHSMKIAVETLIDVASHQGILDAIAGFEEGMSPPWFSKFKPSHRLFQGDNQ